MATNLDLTEEGESTIADALAYKNLTFVRQLRPGEDPAAVTDNQLREAVRVTLDKTNTSTTESPEM